MKEGGNINVQYDVRHVTPARTMRPLQRETGDEPANTFISTLWQTETPRSVIVRC